MSVITEQDRERLIQLKTIYNNTDPQDKVNRKRTGSAYRSLKRKIEKADGHYTKKKSKKRSTKSSNLADPGWQCVECHSIYEISQAQGEPVYQCQCGKTFTPSESLDGESNQCPDCSEYTEQVKYKDTCINCQGGLEEIEIVYCPHCITIFTLQDWEEHYKNEVIDYDLKNLED